MNLSRFGKDRIVYFLLRVMAVCAYVPIALESLGEAADFLKRMETPVLSIKGNLTL